MALLSRKALLAVAAVVDVALHGRDRRVSAKALAGRLALPARHLEPVLQALVHAGVLNGTRGPQGGYQLDRLRITLADVVRAVGTIEAERAPPAGRGLVNVVIRPAVQQAEKTFATALGKIMIDDLVRQAERSNFVSKKR